jgi:NADH:ubiquinone oxidoreductase subunit 6 (subunit J)
MLFVVNLDSATIFCFNNIEESLLEIFIIGQVLYNFSILLVIIVGLVLLVALVGSILLSLDFKKLRLNNSIFRRLSRSPHSVLFFN